jgi:serine O-acetyltransferase
MIVHGTGIVVGAWAKIGRDAILLHGVTIGSPEPTRREAMPTIGDSVFVGAGAKLIGEITIGDDVFIGVNAIVTRDVPAGSRVVVSGGVEVTPPRSAQLA